MKTPVGIGITKPKKSQWLHFAEDAETADDAHAHLVKQMKNHPDLADARIGLAWMLEVSPDKDGHLVLGKCVKAPEIWQHLTDFDFVVGLNREWWREADEGQRAFLVDHELCHAAPAVDGDSGDQKIDDQGFLQWRIKKHDLEEFFGPVERHGLKMANLYRFFEVSKKAQKTLPFSFSGADVEQQTRAVREAVEDLRPSPESSIGSVSITSGGKGIKLGSDGTTERIGEAEPE